MYKLFNQLEHPVRRNMNDSVVRTSAEDLSSSQIKRPEQKSDEKRTPYQKLKEEFLDGELSYNTVKDRFYQLKFLKGIKQSENGRQILKNVQLSKFDKSVIETSNPRRPMAFDYIAIQEKLQ